MKTIIGLTFVLMCPFLGGLFPFVLFGYILEYSYDQICVAFAIYTWIWILGYILWFDGSKYQRIL